MMVDGAEMTLRKTLVACTVTLLNVLAAPAFADDCKPPKTGTRDVPIFSPPLANVVTGTGRLQFYSAPNEHSPMSGVFIVPKGELVAYAETDDGWSQVIYISPRTGNLVSGWVRSARLKQTGTVGPKQQRSRWQPPRQRNVRARIGLADAAYDSKRRAGRSENAVAHARVLHAIPGFQRNGRRFDSREDRSCASYKIVPFRSR